MQMSSSSSQASQASIDPHICAILKSSLSECLDTSLPLSLKGELVAYAHEPLGELLTKAKDLRIDKALELLDEGESLVATTLKRLCFFHWPAWGDGDMDTRHHMIEDLFEALEPSFEKIGAEFPTLIPFFFWHKNGKTGYIDWDARCPTCEKNLPPPEEIDWSLQLCHHCGLPKERKMCE